MAKATALRVWGFSALSSILVRIQHLPLSLSAPDWALGVSHKSDSIQTFNPSINYLWTGKSKTEVSSVRHGQCGRQTHPELEVKENKMRYCYYLPLRDSPQQRQPHDECSHLQSFSKASAMTPILLPPQSSSYSPLGAKQIWAINSASQELM